MPALTPTPPAVRRAGQFGREEVRRVARRGLVQLAAIVLAGLLAGAVIGFTSWAFVPIEICGIGLIVRLDRRCTTEVARRERGAEAEERVGAIIDGLAADGWLSLHDVTAGERGNIDHVIVGPAGVFTVETKSHRGRIGIDRIDRAWLAQAYAQRMAIERITGRRVEALLVFSDAYLIGKAVARTRGVLVLPARMLPGHLARRAPSLSADEVQALHGRLAQALR